jgi:branched-chain amino acid transport system substrate-binding protein
MAGLEVGTPFGKVIYRTQDNQSTMGAYVGRLGLKDGKGVMTDWRYEPGDKHLPSDDVVKARRPAN